MGDGAEASLVDWMRRGYRDNPNYAPKKRPRINCPECGKPVEASEGLREHAKRKHPAMYKYMMTN